MKNKITIIALLSLCSVLGLLLAARISYLKKSDGTVNQANFQEGGGQNTGRLERDYKAHLRAIIRGYKSLSATGLNSSEVSKIKNSLLELRVPKEYKDLHLNLVFAMVKMENYYQNGGGGERDEGERIINRALSDYSWLN